MLKSNLIQFDSETDFHWKFHLPIYFYPKTINQNLIAQVYNLNSNFRTMFVLICTISVFISVELPNIFRTTDVVLPMLLITNMIYNDQ